MEGGIRCQRRILIQKEDCDVRLLLTVVVLYILLSYVPIVALAPGIASVIMLTGLFWAPADHIGNNVVRIIVKGVILLIMVLIEFCVLINATLLWLERKVDKKPIIRVEK